MYKNAFASRTIWLNIIAAVIAILALPEVSTLIPATWLPSISGLVAALNLVLRFTGGDVRTMSVVKQTE